MKDKNRNLAILIILLLINFLFAYKYFSRFSSFGLLGSIAYSGVVLLLYYFLQKSEAKWLKTDLLFWGIVIIYSAIHILLFSQIKVEQLNVDRWSNITAFWQNAFDGKYPYCARSHMGNYPGTFPVYFMLSLPFYLIHEVGYFSLMGFIGFVWFIRKYKSLRDSAVVLIILVLSVTMFWEIIVRSTIIVNATLFLVYIFWLINTDLSKTKYFFATALLGGLLLATRSIFAFVLVGYGVYALKSKLMTFKRLFWWSFILIVTCSCTFIPFLIFYFDDFLKVNPLRSLSEFLFPISYVPVLLSFAGLAGLLCKNKTDLFFWVGIIFFLIFLFYAFRVCFLRGFIASYLSSYVDLSYSLFCLPFLLFAFKDRSSNNIFRV